MLLLRPMLIVALLFSVAACGSDDDDAGPVDEGTAVDDSGETTTTTAGDAAPSSGSPAATVTLADGTTYELEVADCEGSNTDPAGYPDPDSFTLSGRNADADRNFFIARIGPSDEPYTQTGSLEGDFDDEGKNPELLYVADMTTLDVRMNGGATSGSVSARARGANRPFGDDTVIEFVFNC